MTLTLERPASSLNEGHHETRPTWYEIDLDAIAHNMSVLRGLVGPAVAIYACLKRNAYGCGAGPVAEIVAAAGADGIALGNLNDALAIRARGLRLPILLYPNCLPSAADLIRRHDLTISVSSVDEAEAWARAGTGPIKLFVKLDAGAFRAGVLPRDVVPLLRLIASEPSLQLAGIYGHLHVPNPIDDEPYARWQFGNFNAALAAAAAAGIALPIRMLASTGVVLDFPEMDLNGVDPGRLIYGLRPAPTSRRQVELRPALRGFKTRLIMRKSLAEADTGGLPTPFAMRPGMVLGLLPVGWGDGYPRRIPAGACALVRGRRVALLGPVHLEHLRIDLTDVPEAALGDEVVLIGQQGTAEITLAEVARQWGIDATDFHGQMRDHIERRYFRSGAA